MNERVINWVIFGGIFALGYVLGLLNILAGIRIYRSGEKTHFSRKHIPDRWYLKFDENTGYEPVKVIGKAARSDALFYLIMGGIFWLFTTLIFVLSYRNWM